MLILSGAGYVFRNKGILFGKFGKCGATKCFLRTCQVPDVPSRSVWLSTAPVAMLALCPGSLTLQAPLYRHTGRKWTLHKWGLSHFRKVGYLFSVLLPKQELVAFSAMRNSLFLSLSRRPCLATSPSARVSLCMPSLQQNPPFFQPQQVGWAVTFQCRKGLTKSVLREPLEFCFGH